MKHLRKFNENSNRPGPNTGSKSITISQDEVNSFSTEPSLQKLIADEKISVIGTKVYYNDDETKSILDEYLEVAGKVEESLEVYESKKPKKSSSFDEKHDWLYKNVPEYKKKVDELLDKFLDETNKKDKEKDS